MLPGMPHAGAPTEPYILFAIHALELIIMKEMEGWRAICKRPLFSFQATGRLAYQQLREIAGADLSNLV